MNTTMADGAEQRLDAQIAEALFGQPGMSKMDVANRVRELRGDGPALLANVQPGGMVMLGDGLAIESRARELLAHEYAMSGSTKRADKIIAGFDCAPSTEYAVRAIKAALSAQPQYITDAYELGMRDGQALSAQPSPDGQGDARRNAAYDAIDRFLRNNMDDVAYALYEEHLETLFVAHRPVRIYGCCAQPEGELHTTECPNMRHLAARQPEGATVKDSLTVAARQPLGEPAMYQVRPRSFDDGEGWRKVTKREYDDRGPFPGYDEAEWERRTLYAAPAQAVDLGPSQSVLAEVAKERARQEAKWGQQNHVDWTPTSAATDLAGAWPAGVGDHFKFITDYKAKGAEGHRLGYFDILMEEVAEAHDEARDGNTEAVRIELVQVAAVAVAWIECIDRRLAKVDSKAVGNGTDR